MHTEQTLNSAFHHLNSGNWVMAGPLFEGVLQREPHNFAALNGRGFIALQQNRLAQSAADFQQSLAVNPKQAFAHKMLGIVLGAMGQVEASMQAFAAALALDAKDPEVYFNRANFRFQAGQAQAALADLDAAIQLRGSYLEARSNRANLLVQLGDFARAEKDLDYLVNKITNHPDLWVALGLAKHKVGKHKESMRCNERALKLAPNHPDALLNSASASYDQGDYPSSLTWADKAICASPNRAEAHYARAQALMAMSRFEEALMELQQASGAQALMPHVLFKLGACYVRLKRFHEAVTAYQQAWRLGPPDVMAYLLYAEALVAVGALTEAMTLYESAIQTEPQNASLYNDMGVAFERMQLFDRALECYCKAMSLDAENRLFAYNAAGMYATLNRFPEAIALYEKISSGGRAFKGFDEDFLIALIKVCSWGSYAEKYTGLLSRIRSENQLSNPFPLLCLPSTLEEQQICARNFVSDKYHTEQAVLNVSQPRAKGSKIRIAYLSSDFYNHATSYLMAEMFELHDRLRFEVIGVCYGRSPKDEMRERVSKTFDRFIEAVDRSDAEIAAMLQVLDIDIAVDLKGHTQNSRLGIFAQRIAPIQMHYLGYPGTLGAPFIDYLVADPTLIPEAHQRFYSEQIIYLPDTYQVNDRSRRIADIDDTRHDHGLPESGFVYCCFNNNWKITPDIFDVWMKILNRVAGSVLWLFEDNPEAAKNLRSEAVARGVAPERLVFGKRLPLDQHLARHRHAELFLDTLYYNAHTTASDALWTGLPMVTKLGQTYASRVGASLLRAVGLPELVVDSLEAYEALAVDFAMNPEKLAATRRTLADNRLTTPLFDTPRFTRNLEAAYEAIWNRHQQGLAPNHVYV